jgi:hypothetical protein
MNGAAIIANQCGARIAELEAELQSRDATIATLREALESYELAIDEAEAIFGGEYNNHYGPMFELAIEARDKRRAAYDASKADDTGEVEPCIA